MAAAGPSVLGASAEERVSNEEIVVPASSTGCDTGWNWTAAIWTSTDSVVRTHPTNKASADSWYRRDGFVFGWLSADGPEDADDHQHALGSTAWYPSAMVLEGRVVRLPLSASSRVGRITRR